MLNPIDMNEMRRATIEEMRSLLTETIKHIDMICRKEGIKYFAAYGTLLGAVREHGIIPWDDDADLWMMREDYEKFCKVFDKYSGGKYFLDNTEVDKNYCLPFLARVCVNDTHVGYYRANSGFHTGFYIDVYPLDYASTSEKRTILRHKICNYLHRNIVYNTIRSFSSVYGIKKTFFYIIANIFTMRTWTKLYRAAVYNPSPDKSRLICLGEISQIQHLSEDFNETIELKFEDMNIICPAGYDRILRTYYGDDYMIPMDRRMKKVYIKK